MILKISKYFLYIIFLSSLLLLPIYGAARLFLPEYIKKEIINNLPKGSTLSIGSISSKADLTLVFENVIYKSNNNNLIVQTKFIELSPKLSLSQPLNIKTEELYFNQPNFSGNLKNFEATLLVEKGEEKQLSIIGEAKKMEALDTFEFSGLEFLLNGINEKNKIINVEAKSVIFEFKNQLAYFILKGDNVSAYNEMNKDRFSLKADFQDFELNVLKPDQASDEKVIFSNLGKFKMDLYKEKNWQAPISFYLEKIRTSRSEIAENLEISTVGHWSKGELNCSYLDLLRNNKICGIIRDFVKTNISMKDRNGGFLKVNGNGICVTPNANCPQRITAEIKSKKTTQIFSNIMLSGLINPLLGGVLLSGLMTSPEINEDRYDHSVFFEMIGNKILINNNPLF